MLRAFFANGIDKLHPPWVVKALPILLHLSLSLFLASLLIFLFNANQTAFNAIAGWVALFGGIYSMHAPRLRQFSSMTACSTHRFPQQPGSSRLQQSNGLPALPLHPGFMPSVTPYAISLCHVLIFPSLLPYLYDRTALPQSTGLTSAVAAISILSSLFP
jgi:hypothetical protein